METAQGMYGADLSSTHSLRQAQSELKEFYDSVKDGTIPQIWVRSGPKNDKSFFFTLSHLPFQAPHVLHDPRRHRQDPLYITV